MDKPIVPPTSPRGLASYAWWLVLCLVGLDYFSTLAYLPSLAVDEADKMAPFAALGVVALTLFAALPVYLYVIGRSPHGHGATGLLEKHVTGWTGKILILFLLGFIATDFVVTRTLSTADAAKHLIHNPYWQTPVDWMTRHKDSLRASLPVALREPLFDFWNEQLVLTLLLSILGFVVYAFLLRGFSRTFLYVSAFVVVLFLAVNGMVIGSGLVYLYHHPDLTTQFTDVVRYGGREISAEELLFTLFLTLVQFPQLALGLGGFELSMASAPLVRGRPSDDPVQPRGRIRNMRLLLVAAAVLMSLFLAGSVLVVTMLVPKALLHPAQPVQQEPAASQSEMMPQDEGDDLDVPAPSQPVPTVEKEGPARDRALAYIAHGGTLAGGLEAQQVSPLFGPAFGTLYDVSTVLILCLAGASVTISLRDLVPGYLTRFGMQMEWARKIGVILHLFNLVILVVIVVFKALSLIHI